MPATGESDRLTIMAIAIVAYAACDMVHEVLGHGIAVAVSPDVAAVSLSTVALQTTRRSRVVAGAGSLANVLAGAAALWWSASPRRSSHTRLFAWLLGTLSLLNGTGYLVFSGALNTGDWTVVIEGARPGWLWRAGLVLAG